MLYFKKGQLEIGITMMVLLVFIILLIVSLAFYFRFTQGSIKETKQEILDEKFSGLLDVLINLPELRYSLNGAEKNCLDIDKINNFKGVIENSLVTRKSEYYTNLLGDVNAIWVDIFNIDDIKNPVQSVFYGIKGKGLVYSSPISICDGNEFKIGKLNIQTK